MPELKITPEQQAYMQTKIDGWNDCFILMHKFLVDFTENPLVPKQTSEIVRGFVDSMGRDQGALAVRYANSIIKELSAPVN